MYTLFGAAATIRGLSGRGLSNQHWHKAQQKKNRITTSHVDNKTAESKSWSKFVARVQILQGIHK